VMSSNRVGGAGGKMSGLKHWDVEPDIMVMAKGQPMAPGGLTIATPEVGDSLKDHTSPPSVENPVTATAILATIDVIEKGNFLQNAEKMGILLRDRLKVKEKYQAIGEVRGMGLFKDGIVKGRKSLPGFHR